VVVIGGITSSLILTLVLVPIMYMWLAPEHFVPSHGIPQGPTPPVADGVHDPAATSATARVSA
jgi:hypothetical protein